MVSVILSYTFQALEGKNHNNKLVHSFFQCLWGHG